MSQHLLPAAHHDTNVSRVYHSIIIHIGWVIRHALEPDGNQGGEIRYGIRLSKRRHRNPARLRRRVSIGVIGEHRVRVACILRKTAIGIARAGRHIRNLRSVAEYLVSRDRNIICRCRPARSTVVIDVAVAVSPVGTEGAAVSLCVFTETGAVCADGFPAAS